MQVNGQSKKRGGPKRKLMKVERIDLKTCNTQGLGLRHTEIDKRIWFGDILKLIRGHIDIKKQNSCSLQ